MTLALCNSCRRHVRSDEPQCPFCGGAVGAPTNRAIGRAPRVAVLFAGALGIAGCSAVDDGGAVALYGAPIHDTGLSDASSAEDSAKTDSAPRDTGSSADSASTDSASSDTASDTGGAVPPYGAPMEDSGGD